MVSSRLFCSSEHLLGSLLESYSAKPMFIIFCVTSSCGIVKSIDQPPAGRLPQPSPPRGGAHALGALAP